VHLVGFSQIKPGKVADRQGLTGIDKLRDLHKIAIPMTIVD
jgi:hypothetical protein